MQCSPAREREGLKDGCCLKLAELQTVASLLNKEHETSLNQIQPIPLSAFVDRKLLIAALTRHFAPTCGQPDKTNKNKNKHQGQEQDGQCWLKQPVMKINEHSSTASKQLFDALQNAYKPHKPSAWKKNRREWLNTFDILTVMKQYEAKYTTFEFLGVFPVDFAKTVKDTSSSAKTCIVQDMCNFNLDKLKASGKLSFGIVMNLDRHNEPGSHWVACYCCFDPKNTKKYGICYYDSGGELPPTPIADFIKTVIHQVDDPKNFKKKYNNTRHQFKNTECGIFSMLFVTLCLNNPHLTYHALRSLVPRDKNDNQVNKLRDHFYQESV
jgi:hypothetical protein